MVTAAAWKPFRAGMMMKETMVSGSLKNQLFVLKVHHMTLKTRRDDDDGAAVRVNRMLLTYTSVVIRCLDFRHVEVMPVFSSAL